MGLYCKNLVQILKHAFYLSYMQIEEINDESNRTALLSSISNLIHPYQTINF